MIFEYERPLAEIIDFITLEKLANSREEKDSRDSRAGEGGGAGGVFSKEEDVWDDF